MNERLEEINNVLKDYKNLQEQGLFGQADTALLYLAENHINWLIKQAKRVEELEEENENVKHQSFQQELDIAVLESENKRYKKALERIVYEDISGWSSQDILGKVIDIAHEALEGESE